MELNKIYNEDCRDTMVKHIDNKSIDVILTSPFYNTNKKAGKSTTLNNVGKNISKYIRYDVHVDNLTNEEYCSYMVDLFNKFDTILKDDGCVLFNISYGAENTECMWLTIADILRNTNFTLADNIIWKKRSAMPNNCSPNKLTRIVEYVFVFCKKTHFKTFKCNKQVVSTRSNGQKMYENIFNFVEAKNNDGVNELNKATYSTDLCLHLLNIYAQPNSIVYDPFMGTGTTANACLINGHKFIGSEISKAQCEFALTRLGLTSSTKAKKKLKRIKV